MELYTSRVGSPVGDLHIVTNGKALVALAFAENRDQVNADILRHATHITLVPSVAPKFVSEPLSAYFGGDMRALQSIPVKPFGTEFQKRVWSCLRSIEPGVTWTYGQLARRIGLQAGSASSISAAHCSNPVMIILPCHRVASSHGSISHYAGGLDKKVWLLKHEGYGSNTGNSRTNNGNLPNEPLAFAGV